MKNPYGIVIIDVKALPYKERRKLLRRIGGDKKTAYVVTANRTTMNNEKAYDLFCDITRRLGCTHHQFRPDSPQVVAVASDTYERLSTDVYKAARQP